jgi:hypothetical protein
MLQRQLSHLSDCYIAAGHASTLTLGSDPGGLMNLLYCLTALGVLRLLTLRGFGPSYDISARIAYKSFFHYFYFHFAVETCLFAEALPSNGCLVYFAVVA